MKKYSLFVGLVYLMASSAFAQAMGSGSSGGGGSVVCRDANNKIKSAELLDLYEAPIINGIWIQRSAKPYLEQVDSALKKFENPYYQYLVAEVVETIKEQFQFLPDGVSLNQPSDIGENQPAVVPDGCRLEGLGFYKDNKLFVAKTTFDSLSETDKAAFIIHEAVYYLYREYRLWASYPKNSIDSRKMTSLLFSALSYDIERNFQNMIDWPNEDAERVLLPKSQDEYFKVVVEPELKDSRYDLYVECSDYFKGDLLQKKELIDVWGRHSIEINRYCRGIKISVIYTDQVSRSFVDLFYNNKKVFNFINDDKEFLFARAK